MPKTKSKKRPLVTYPRLKTLKTFNQIEYEERFFWDKLIIMETIDLNNKELRQRTQLLLTAISEEEFFTSKMTPKQISDIAIKFEAKKFNNIYQILDDILELMFKMPKIKNHTIFDFLPMESFLMEENFQIFKERILEIFEGICTETISNNGGHPEFEGNDYFVYMEIESLIYSFSLSREKRRKIFDFIQENYPDSLKQDKDRVFNFDHRSLPLESAYKLLSVIKSIK